MQDHTFLRDEITRLLETGQVNGHAPEAFGDWAEVVELLHAAAATKGAEGVQRALGAMLRTDKKLARIWTNAPAAQRGDGIPPLPQMLRELAAREETCAQWIDDYIAYAQKAAPMSPYSFHEACALWAAATTIAGRVVVRAGVGRYAPNLMIFLVAVSALYKKSTAQNVARDLMERTGLNHLLLPDGMTPQLMLEQLCPDYIPEREISWDADGNPTAKDAWLKQRAFAKARSSLVDEVVAILDRWALDYMKGAQSDIIKYYDGAAHSDGTSSRGTLEVVGTALGLNGATTPENLAPHFANRKLWASGLWSRIDIIVPDEKPVFAPIPDPITPPGNVVHGLRRLYELFPIPHASLDCDQTAADQQGGRNKKPVRTAFSVRLELTNNPPPAVAQIGEGVQSIWNIHARAMFDIIHGGLIEPILNSAYDRMTSKLIKVSLILASIDAAEAGGAVAIELRHACRALRIVERWRRFLHTAWGEVAATDEETLMDRIVAELQKASPAGRTGRELQQRLHVKKDELDPALQQLVASGAVDVAQGRKAVYTLIMPEAVASVANRSTPAATHSSPSQSPKRKSVAV